MKDYLWKYTCKMIQQPAVLSKTVILFKGLEGSGKDSYFQALENILGQRYYSTVDTMDSMFGNFNSVIQDKILISLNEMTGKNGLDYQERIKPTSDQPKEHHQLQISKTNHTDKQYPLICKFEPRRTSEHQCYRSSFCCMQDIERPCCQDK